MTNITVLHRFYFIGGVVDIGEGESYVNSTIANSILRRCSKLEKFPPIIDNEMDGWNGV